jgi:shikimate dehydrogenase
MKIYGLIGYPLSHSFSQIYFTQKFQNENILDCRFDLFPIEHIEQILLLLKSIHSIKGLAVTIPFKEKILPFLTELDSNAHKIKAVNCITFSKDGLKGYNTDIIGFEKSILPLIQPHHKRALILGSGGSSKAVVFVMEKIGIEYLIVSRNCINSSNYISYTDINEDLMSRYNVVVNCTPIGQFPNNNNRPDIPYQFITPQHLFFDLIYNPIKSDFLKMAESKGAIIKNGREMLEIQAEENWKLWNQK